MLTLNGWYWTNETKYCLRSEIRRPEQENNKFLVVGNKSEKLFTNSREFIRFVLK